MASSTGTASLAGERNASALLKMSRKLTIQNVGNWEGEGKPDQPSVEERRGDEWRV
jgi:hypothetical protein